METITESYRTSVSIKSLKPRLHKSTRSVAINPSCYRVQKEPSKKPSKSKVSSRKSLEPKKKKSKIKRSESKSSRKSKDKRKCKKLKDPITMTSLKKNVGRNCCVFCGIFVEYVKESVRLICLRECSREPRITEILGDLYEALGCLCCDCIGFIKYILRLLIVYK